MARVMMIGYGPLPRPGLSYMAAPALRTRHFLKPILDAGHTVNLYTLPLRPPPGHEGEMAAMIPDTYENLAYQRFANHDENFAVAQLAEQARQIQPDAIVGVNTFPSWVAARLPARVPLWADLNGHWMAEMQGKARVENDDHWIGWGWGVQRGILRRLDKFSAVSRPQLHAVLGELGAVGRMNRHTFDYPFGHHVPNAAYRWDSALEAEPNQEPLLRGPIVPADAFIILWSGGFNVWADIPTLVEAMDRLMEHHPNVHMVVTGGRIEGHVTRPYEEFEERVEASPHKDRFHLLGWVESEDLPRIYRESDLGINVDSRNYETLFGARNRINTMAAVGLPVATTLGTEISEWLDEGQAVLSAPIGDAEALAEAIAPHIGRRYGLREVAGNALRIMKRDFSYARTTRKLLDWLEAPAFAPDNQLRLERAGEDSPDPWRLALNPVEEESLLLETHGVGRLRQGVETPETGGHNAVSRFLFGSRRSR